MRIRGDTLVIYRLSKVLFLAVNVLHFIAVGGSGNMGASPSNETSDSYSIEEILAKYAGHSTRPRENSDRPDLVSCALREININEVDQAKMEFTITMTLELTWEDYRLQDLMPADSDIWYSIRGASIDNIWLPDLYFPLLKSGDYHKITSTNRIVRVNKKLVHYASRMTLTQSCTMDLAFFPFDSQKCDTHISTFAYTNDELLLSWKADSLAWSVKLNVPHFIYHRLQTTNFTSFDTYGKDASTFNYSALNVSIHMQRKSTFYIATHMTSLLLLAVLSWLNYWLDPEQTPARISLGVTTVLAAITQASNAQSGLPHLSYITALDVWLCVCLNVTIVGLAEYALVHILVFRAKSQSEELKRLQTARLSKTSGLPNQVETSFVYRHKAETPGIVPDDATSAPGPSSAPSAEEQQLRHSVLRSWSWARRIDVSMRIFMPIFLFLFFVVYMYIVIFIRQ